MTKRSDIVDVIAVEPLDGFVLRVWFSDGAEKDVDVERFLRGPVFEPLLRDPGLFRRVRVEFGTVAWPNGADIDPVVLRGHAEPA